MSEFSGLWKHQTNPACTRSVRNFRVLKLGTIRKKKPQFGWLVEPDRHHTYDS